jgi:hypothetical protein
MGQCSVFVRNHDLFAQDPFRITIDEPFVDELADLITRFAIGGLPHADDARLKIALAGNRSRSAWVKSGRYPLCARTFQPWS